jgi:putative heme transporter
MNFKSFKLWLNIVTIGALLVLIFIARHQIGDAFGRLADLNYFWLAFIIPLQLGNYYSTARFYKSYLSSLGEELLTKTLFKVALEMNFVNNVFPSGGVSGFGYLGIRLRKEGVPASKSTLTQVTRHSLTFLSFIIYITFALLLLSLFGNASRLMVLISTSIIFLVLIGAGLLIYLISSASRIKTFTAFLPRVINKVLNLFKRVKKPTIDIERIERLFGDLHKDYLHVRSNWKSLRTPFKWTMFMNLTELSTIFVVYLAFGTLVNPGAIIIAYAVANLAGLVAVLPGGVGIYEGLMTAVLAAAGVAKALALSATLVYRVLNMIIFLPVGFIFYQIALRDNKMEKISEIKTTKDEPVI